MKFSPFSCENFQYAKLISAVFSSLAHMQPSMSIFCFSATQLKGGLSPLQTLRTRRVFQVGSLRGWLGGWRTGWEAGWLSVNGPCDPFGTSTYTCRASIPEVWEAGRLGSWLGGWELAGWEAGWLSVNVPCDPFGTPMGETQACPPFLTTPIEDSRFDSRILLTKWPSNFGSSIGMSIGDALKT